MKGFLKAIGMAAVVAVRGAAGQTPDTVATFEKATSVSMAPDGTIWVADRGRLMRRSPGESGADSVPTAGNRPVAVDAPSALAVVVADPEAGVVDRIGPDGNLLLRLFIPEDAERALRQNPSFSLQGPGESVGFPDDVVELPSGRLAVTERASAMILLFDSAGRMESTISEVDGSPLFPSAIAAGGQFLAALDPGSTRVAVFDEFGTHAFSVPTGPSPQALAADSEGFWIIGERTAANLLWDGRLLREVDGIPGEVVDAEAGGNRLYILTPERLLSYPLR